ncbi:M56 family peptidase [Rhodococcus sp. ABRD24]|uniref:M56 family metallopeptidase n=1 Tax=Rhodococcus sp. ABRD24 TaxID=2507582 RepID=UPI001039F0F3|nr:M56 family metallopeptidase [Rhodococcus sp. ABRD24]QBJ97384.1 M56 family peptidase [Rhodococcus sp. ABRD24]
MIVASGLLIAAFVLGFLAPQWLNLLAVPRRHPRVALAAWIGSQVMFVLALSAVPFALWLRPGHQWNIVPPAAVSCVRAIRDGGVWPWFPLVEVAVWVGGLVFVARIAAVVGSTLVRHRRTTDSHAAVLRIVGRRDSAEAGDVFQLPGEGFAAYSIGGRTPAIALGDGVVALDPVEREAVLAHERAHLRGRHHLLVAWADGFRAALPFVPLSRVGANWVRILVELSADRHAAQSCGPAAVCAALENWSGGRSTGQFVEDRVTWLSGQRAPRRAARMLHYPFALTLSVLPVFVAVSAVATALVAYCAALGG